MTVRSNMRSNDQPGIRFRAHSTPYQRRSLRGNRRPLYDIGRAPKESAFVAFLGRHVSKADSVIVVICVLAIVAMLSGWPS